MLDVLAFPIGLVMTAVGAYLADRYVCSPIEAKINEHVPTYDVILERVRDKIHSSSLYQRHKG